MQNEDRDLIKDEEDVSPMVKQIQQLEEKLNILMLEKINMSHLVDQITEDIGYRLQKLENGHKGNFQDITITRDLVADIEKRLKTIEAVKGIVAPALDNTVTDIYSRLDAADNQIMLNLEYVNKNIQNLEQKLEKLAEVNADFSLTTNCESCGGEGSFSHHAIYYECKACNGTGIEDL